LTYLDLYKQIIPSLTFICKIKKSLYIMRVCFGSHPRMIMLLLMILSLFLCVYNDISVLVLESYTIQRGHMIRIRQDRVQADH